MTNFDELIASANMRLKNQNLRIKIAKRGSTLYLRGYLPLKTGEPGLIRQNISLGITASLVGLQLAEAEAIKIAASVSAGVFSWEPYVKKEDKSRIKTAKDWIEEFEKDYFNKRARNGKTELTWKKDYIAIFRKLDQGKPLTIKTITKAILSTEPDTRMRQRCCMVLNILAKFANIEIDTNQYSGNYSYKKVKPRNIPDDKLISSTIKSIDNTSWQWAIALLATYGLRNHEIFLVDFDSLAEGNYILKVNSGKTNFRRVCPIYPEWVKEFDLYNVKTPDINLNRSNDKLGHTVSQFFRRKELPFRAYDLRHAWAIRSLLFGLDVSLAAQMMGHSLKIHTDTYQHWINEQHYQRAFEILINRNDRPLPP